MVRTLLNTDNSTKGMKVETTIHHANQPQLSVKVSMIESLNEELEIKLLGLSVFLHLVTVASCNELGSKLGMCILWGPLTQCDWQNKCCMFIYFTR